VHDTITEWVKYANIKFRFEENPAISQLRISFDFRSGSWSYVGMDNLKITDAEEATMNLGGIWNTKQISANERGAILHEFGHALGLMHEHQSPARGGTLHLKKSGTLS
jgi:hypothetical protein